MDCRLDKLITRRITRPVGSPRYPFDRRLCIFHRQPETVGKQKTPIPVGSRARLSNTKPVVLQTELSQPIKFVWHESKTNSTWNLSV